MAARALMSAGEVIVAADAERLAARAADFIAERASQDFRLVLAGGSTPRALYERLASDAYRDRIDWAGVHIFFGDERCVPHDHPRSNYHMAFETLLSHVPIPAQQIHPIPTGTQLQEDARSYEVLLKDFYGSSTLDPARPLFDLVLLGLGSDGHIASLFPGDPALDERQDWALGVMREEPRITLTFPALESSKAIAFLVTGAEKAAAMRAARARDKSIPAGRLQPQGELFWFLDEDAAGARP
jgi:6-phosphogluconolactonase